ncbi:hypothetical protein EVAR_10051_1 [Eumeta japonica]|uniref:Uncharacterized protein n=1 Tax=Eumeta variegata TaxID=151549 RepID=A0A4C1TR89_EUMVA|nr:hypothetical protein EVAR_10051_1 [Eumeta japonica]
MTDVGGELELATAVVKRKSLTTYGVLRLAIASTPPLIRGGVLASIAPLFVAHQPWAARRVQRVEVKTLFTLLQCGLGMLTIVGINRLKSPGPIAGRALRVTEHVCSNCSRSRSNPSPSG